MLNCFLFLGALQNQTPQAVALADAQMGAAQQRTWEYTMTEAGGGAVAHCRFAVASPDKQWFYFERDGEKIEFRQSAGRAIIIRHESKEYEEYVAPSVPSPPPQRSAGFALAAILPFGYSRSLVAFAGKDGWTQKGNESVSGVTCNVVTATSTGTVSSGSHTAWIDSEGKIRRWKRTFEDAEGSREVQFDFKPGTSQEGIHFKPDLPLGYLPNRLPLPLTKTVRVDDAAPVGKWLDARTGKTIDVAATSKGAHAVVVFTDPESAICQKIEPFLVSLRKRLKAHKCAFVEVVLSQSRPNTLKSDKDRTVFWDMTGDIERAWGVPGTPYFLMFDGTQTLVRGWQGYRKIDEDKIVENFVSAFISR